MNRNEIIVLASQKSKNCLSIYIPTHQKGHEVKEGYDKINLKNQIKEAEQKLEQKGLLENEIKEFLKPVQDLVEDSNFWSNQKQGLAIFVGDNFFKTVSLPFAVEEHTVVSSRMHVKNKKALFNTNNAFFS